MNGKVDPAALIFSVFTVAFSPLTSVGPWSLLNTAIAVVVGVVVAAFNWPRKETVLDECGKITLVDPWIMFAQAGAYGLIVVVGIAWIVQSIWLLASPGVSCQTEPNGNYSQACITIANRVTWVAMLIGLAAVIILFSWMRRRIGKIAGEPLKRLVWPPWLSQMLRRGVTR